MPYAIQRLTPVYTIPNEILGHIFILGVESARQSCKYLPYPCAKISHDVLETTLFRHSILSVCAHWRDTALAMPALWQLLDITPRIPLAYVSAALQQSRILPLTITISDCCPCCADAPLEVQAPLWTPSALHTILEALTPHASRWQSLSFMIRDHSLVELLAIHSTPALSHTALHTLTIWVPHTPGSRLEWDVFPPQSILECPPASLQVLSIYGIWVQWSNILLSTSTLVDLALCHIQPKCNIQHFAHVLAQLPMLRRLTLAGDLVKPPFEHPEDLPQVDLTRLQYLALRDLDPAFAVHMLRMQTYPALTHLVLKLGPGFSIRARHYTAFAQALIEHPLAIHVTDLDLHELSCLSGLSGGAVPIFFSFWPSLKRLSLHFQGLGPGYWRALCSSLPSCVPSLQRLYVTEISPLDVQEFVATRLNVGLSLPRLQLRLADAWRVHDGRPPQWSTWLDRMGVQYRLM
ncbi:predicted protein [Postia placenta Mad-698-R]|uniref:F-box domain-containing protein n=1 Tax=Postia placenta MAD-698-R-SB12 TaxID=670580 RepID=A0A1X6N113_9APHY|nr:hypothetical protein POSPLADRAFT_1046668 [Postia placenta MAD-698-R-SB12]EED82567.1 predicted protein [Postia placenta Mad-698-R]OSX62308.1 hypothetical protein POSPLADRAFT_1046668 [Postia placenta MAD-698-R-SB12]